jgi:hypothetical protein
MARVASEKQINTFTRGVITEANPLTYPENASIDEANFVLKRDGSRERRLGIDYESSYGLISSTFTSTIISGTVTEFYHWEKAGGTETIGIVRIFNKLWFLDLQTANPSDTLLNGGNPITIPELSNSPSDGTSTNNSFIITCVDSPNPIYLVYNKDTDTVTYGGIPITTRDIWGVQDDLSDSERPLELTDTHKYNLINQGWSPEIVHTCAETATVVDAGADLRITSSLSSPTEDSALANITVSNYVYTGKSAIECTFEKITVYPSNADIWSLGKKANASASDYQKYDPETLKRNSYDNTPTQKGKIVVDAFNRGYWRNLQTICTLPVDRENGRVSTVAAFASRIFYAGVISNITEPDNKSPNFSNHVFFSKTIKNASDYGKCYQEADPTSDNISDIIDTDGGIIQITEVSQITKLLTTRTSLLVFATNGVWEIYAGDIGFKATEYQISKVTDIGCTNPGSVVYTDGVVIYWSNGGIYLLAPDNVSGKFTAQNVSLATIQTWYNNLSEAAKANASGFFDEREQVIRWLYNEDDTYDGVSYRNKYNKELIFDLSLKAFYFNSISSLTTNSPYIASYVSIPNYVNREIEEQIVAGGEIVQAGGEDVVATTVGIEPRGVSLKYLTLIPSTTFNMTLSEFKNDAFVDWYEADDTGVDFTSYLVTGQELFGDIMRNKQIPYILFYFKRTEDGFDSNTELEHQSSCLVQARWGWSDSANSGKWGTQFQAYRFRRNYVPSGPADTFDYGESVIVSKSKLRGSGKAISLYITSEPGKDMKLLGWAMKLSGNSDV